MKVVIDACGVFSWPLGGLLLLATAVFTGYVSAYIRGAWFDGAAPWKATLAPLSDLAFATGLLGSICGFIASFGGLGASPDSSVVTSGLALAYYTTGWGIVVGLLAMAGEYLLDILDSRPGKEPGMRRRAVLALIDVLFLTLGGLALLLTKMEELETIPIEVSEVTGGYSRVVDTTKRTYVSVTAEGLAVDGEPVDETALRELARDRDVVLGADCKLPTERTLSIVALLSEVGSRVVVHVQPRDGDRPAGRTD